LKHIELRHGKQFKHKGVTNVSVSIKEILEKKPLKVTSDKRGYFAIDNYRGQKYGIAYGTNGFIVSASPLE